MGSYTGWQMFFACIGAAIFGMAAVYLTMRQRIDWIGEETTYEPQGCRCEVREDGFPPTYVEDSIDREANIRADLDFDPMSAHSAYEARELEAEALRHEREREKPSLDVYIKSLLVAGYVMVDGIPRRFAFCITEGERDPYANMYYYGEEYDDVLQIYIDDHRRLESPPDWYGLIFDCNRLTGAMKLLVGSINSMRGVKLTTYERPIKMVIHGDAYLPVLKVYDDMSWFEDLRWKGPVIVVGRDGEARGIVPDEMPFELYEYSEKLVKDSHQYFEQIPLSDERCVNLQEAINLMRTTIEEAGCHA